MDGGSQTAWKWLQRPTVTFEAGAAQIERLLRLASLARGEQELGYEVEVIEGEVTAASVVDPSQRIAAAGD